MAKKIGIIVIHGIGEQESTFADDLIKEVRTRLKGKADAVCWQPVWWAPLLEGDETALLRDLSSTNDLDWMRLRRFIIHFLGDAVAYQRVPDGAERRNIYGEIHKAMADGLHNLRENLRSGMPNDAPEAPLVIIGHSLGCHIASNHVWDLQHGGGKPVSDNPFERCESLAGIVTFGCNIPLFTLAYNKMEPIAFPPKSLATFFRNGVPAQDLKAAAKWINLYDPDDVLGYPLRPLSAAYANTVTIDRAINAGGLLTSWNPASHNDYWTDDDVTKPITELIEGLLDLT
jgi:hypothetical protein